jgi:hypothetical protein
MQRTGKDKWDLSRQRRSNPEKKANKPKKVFRSHSSGTVLENDGETQSLNLNR